MQSEIYTRPENDLQTKQLISRRVTSESYVHLAKIKDITVQQQVNLCIENF